MKTINGKKYHIFYIVNILYNNYKFESLDDTCTFVKYCVLGCTNTEDLADITVKIKYEEVDDEQK